MIAIGAICNSVQGAKGRIWGEEGAFQIIHTTRKCKGKTDAPPIHQQPRILRSIHVLRIARNEVHKLKVNQLVRDS